MSTALTGVARSVAAVRARVSEWHQGRQRVALVPTMGALHLGHRALVEMARHQADRVVVSVFVNPKQFGPNEDFQRYPRQEGADLDLLQEVGADLLYAPPMEAIYPPGFATGVTIGGSLAEVLEGAHRPGHFDGVATVVTKLFTQIGPDMAIFGEKDWQQLQVVRQLTRDLDLAVEILGVQTVRDAHGLALSSRNAYLTPEQLATARKLNVILGELAELALTGAAGVAKVHADAADRLRAAGFDRVDYASLVDAETLTRTGDTVDRPARILAAVHLGGTRLIDNRAVEPA